MSSDTIKIESSCALMKLKLIVVFFCSIFFYHSFCNYIEESIELIEKYLIHRHLKKCTFVMCWPPKDINFVMKSIKYPTRFCFIENYATQKDYNDNRMLYILDFNCNGSSEIFKNVAQNRGLKYKDKWLILTKLSNNTIMDFIKPEFKNIDLRFDSDVKLVTKKAPLILYDIFNTGFGKNGSLIINYYGYWNDSISDLVIIDRSKRYHQNSMLSGVTLKSSTVIQNPTITNNFHEYLTNKRSMEDFISKFGYQMFTHFLEMHNFTHIQNKRDKWFGNSDGGFDDGVAQDIYMEASDLTSVVALEKAGRFTYFDFLNPMFHFSSSFVFRNRGSHNLWEMEFLKPFNTNVWISILLIILLLCILLKIANTAEIRYLRAKNRYSILTTFLLTVSIICQQGSWILPSRYASRFLFFIILTLSFLLYNYYTSSIVSALLNSKPKELTTFKDLIKSGLQLGIQMAPYTITILETNKDADIQTIRKLIFPPNEKPKIWNETDGLDKVRRGGYAYHMETGRAYIEIAKTFDPQAICEISDKIGFIPKSSRLSFFLKKDSQYRNLLKRSVRKMEEFGLVHRNRQIWEGKKPECLANTIVLSVGLDQTFIAFFFLLIGYSIALSILIIEKIFIMYR